MINKFFDKLKLSSLSGCTEKRSKRLDEISIALRKFVSRKSIYFKLTAIAMAVILLAVYGVHLYRHNLKFPDTERVICSMGERIEYGGNLIEIWTTPETSKSADGYFITLSNPRVMNFNEFVEAYALDEETAKAKNNNSTSGDLLLVDVCLENESCADNWENKIPLYDMLLFGYDWYTFNNFELSELINTSLPQSDYAGTEPGTQVNFTLIYGIDKVPKSKLSDADMWIHLTVSPQQLDVKVEV